MFHDLHLAFGLHTQKQHIGAEQIQKVLDILSSPEICTFTDFRDFGGL